VADSKVWYYPPIPRAQVNEVRKANGLPLVGPDMAKAGREWLAQSRAGLAKQKEVKRERRVTQYLAAEAKHALRGPAPAEVVEQRIALCRACPGRVDVFHGHTDDGGIGFCTKCGCPASQRSKLSVKLTIAGTACPLKKFGAVDGTGGSLASAVQAVKGLAATAAAVLKQAVANDGDKPKAQ